jgi:hypothetical protein
LFPGLITRIDNDVYVWQANDGQLEWRTRTSDVVHVSLVATAQPPSTDGNRNTKSQQLLMVVHDDSSIEAYTLLAPRSRLWSSAALGIGGTTSLKGAPHVSISLLQPTGINTVLIAVNTQTGDIHGIVIDSTDGTTVSQWNDRIAVGSDSFAFSTDVGNDAGALMYVAKHAVLSAIDVTSGKHHSLPALPPNVCLDRSQSR